MMRGNTIWITGVEGRLGSELEKKLSEDHDFKVIGTDKDVDITDLDAVNEAVDIYRPTIVINCAGLSDAEYCENNMVEAFKVNALGVRNLATASRRVNAKIVQMSTDDIFEGKTEGTWTEFDTPNAMSVYGKSKLAGETYVKELNPKHLIIRSSWVYGIGQGDYFDFVEEQGKKGEAFEVAMDRISSPTSAKELSNCISALINRTEYGIYHASTEGVCSRYDFAKAILSGLGYDANLAKGVNVNEGGIITSTHLENLMMKMTESYDMPTWEEDLAAYIKRMKED